MAHHTTEVRNFDRTPRGVEDDFLRGLADDRGELDRAQLAALVFTPLGAAAIYGLRRKARALRAALGAANQAS
jgi:hypothetical protein